MSDVDKLVVDGVVDLSISDESDCICCPVFHVFGYGMNLSDYPGRWPYDDPNWRALSSDFVRRAFGEHGYGVDGKRVRITLELVDG